MSVSGVSISKEIPGQQVTRRCPTRRPGLVSYMVASMLIASSHCTAWGAADKAIVPTLTPSRTFNLAACFNIADQNNRDIAVARHNIAIAKAGIKIAGALPNPQLQLQTGFGDSFLFLFTGQTQQALITELLQTAGKRSKRIAVARENLTLTDLQLAALRFDIHNRVRRAYAELAAAEANVALIENQREVALKLFNLAKARANSSNDSNVMQAKLNVDQFDPQKNQAQGRLQQASTNLALMLGEKPERVEVFDIDDNGMFDLAASGTRIVPSPDQPMPAVEHLIRTAFGARWDLKMAECRVRLSRKSLTLSRAERIPDLTVGLGVTFAAFAKNQPAGLSDASNYFGEGAFFTLSAETPVFYQHQGEIQQAAATLNQSIIQVDLLKSQIAASLIADYSAVKSARSNLFLLRNKLLPKSAEVARTVLDGYEKGKIDLATALVAQQQYQQNLSTYFDTVVNYQTGWADLERDVGISLQN